MLRLNLGAGAHQLDGFVNLTPPAWRFQEGLGRYEDGSVDGITISHALMYLPLADWPALFTEIARVLKPGGVVRVTEDATDDRASERFGGWHDAVTLTSAKLVAKHLRAAGLRVPRLKDPLDTRFADGSLVQQWHGSPPKVFHVEGVKP